MICLFHLCFSCHPSYSGFLLLLLNSFSLVLILSSPATLNPYNSLLCFFQLLAKRGSQRTENETAISNHCFKSCLRCLHPYLCHRLVGTGHQRKSRQNPPKDYGAPPTLLDSPHESSRVQTSHQEIAQSLKPYKNQGFHFSVAEPVGSVLVLGVQKEGAKISQAPGERTGSESCSKALDFLQLNEVLTCAW